MRVRPAASRVPRPNGLGADSGAVGALVYAANGAAGVVTGSPAPGPSLLLVDDEEGVAATLAAVLEADGYRVETARTVDEALARIAETTFTAAVLDLGVGADDGLVVLSQLKETSPATVAVV